VDGGYTGDKFALKVIPKRWVVERRWTGSYWVYFYNVVFSNLSKAKCAIFRRIQLYSHYYPKCLI